MTEQEIKSCKEEMYEWQEKVNKAARAGDTGEMSAAMFCVVSCQIRLIDDRLAKLESAICQLEPIGR